MSQDIDGLNAANEAARFNDVLSSYFRVSTAGQKRRGKRRDGRRAKSTDASKDSETCSGTYLEQLKRLLRDANSAVQSQYIQRLYALLLHQFKRAKNSPVIFSKAIELCRELFKRSAVFRALVSTQTASFFDQMLVAAGATPSANASKALRGRSRSWTHVTAVLTLIENWKEDFGERYPALVAGHAVLTERGYVFPNAREKKQEEDEQAVDALRHRERVSVVKKQQRDREMKRYVPEMEQVLVEMNRVFEILVPTMDAFFLPDDGERGRPLLSADGNAAAAHQEEQLCESKNDVQSDVECSTQCDEDDPENVEWEDVPSTERVDAREDVKCGNAAEDNNSCDAVSDFDSDEDDGNSDTLDINDIVQAYGLGSSSYRLTVEVSKQACEESSENDALFRNLGDGALRLRKRFIPLLDDWKHYTTNIERSASSESTLQSQIRDLRDRMTHALLKWDDLVQGSKVFKRDALVRCAVVSLPLDAYKPATKRRRR
uniref:VHS domain-containing protein n=1 Tax=Hyaloperonospora arabidopsidis (strain Emoy2) TaxID=559515 RepID=M4BTS5_HYAAE